MNPDAVRPLPASAPQRRPPRWTEAELAYRDRLERYYAESPGSHTEKLNAFPKYVTRQTLARFLALQDLFRMTLDVPGDTVECGVHAGGGLMTFAQLSAIFEPVNLQRRIIGFDTFAGFPAITPADTGGAAPNPELRKGGFAADSLADLERCIELYDANRVIGHLQKVVLVPGDATGTIPSFLAANPHTVVSLLHLDFDLYEPTRVALEHFLPRMPKGAVVVFDELNHPAWPGETVALAETVGIRSLRLRRFSFEPYISYAVIE